MSSGERPAGPAGSRRRDRLALVTVLLVTLAARLLPAYALGVEVADLRTYRHMALTVLRNQDIYEIPIFFPYTPLSLFLPVVGLRLSELTGLPFHLAMKVFPLAGDLGTAALVYLVARRRWPTGRAALAGLGFALNPVSILVTGFHGNVMPLSVFFAFWAYYLVEFGRQRRSDILSALALGIGIGLRSWPVLLTPFLARPGRMSLRQRCLYVVTAAMPALAVLVPYMLVNFSAVVREAFGYKSTPDFGWIALWRYWHVFATGSADVPLPPTWLANSRLYFLGVYAVLAALAQLRPRAVDTTGWVMAALLLDYTMVGGVAAQYFSWIVPFLVLRPYFGLTFSLIAAAAMMGFYLTWHPGIVLGPSRAGLAFVESWLGAWNLCSVAALWASGVLWLLWFGVRILSAPATGQVRDAARVDARIGSRPGTRWVAGGIALLTGAVVLAVAVEIPYLARRRPAPELPAELTLLVNKGGREPGQLGAPLGVAVHPSGDIYVADTGNARVQRLSATGHPLASWPNAGTNPTALREPSDVAISASGDVYVLDSSGSIVRLQDGGGLVRVVDLAPLSAYAPRGLALDDTRRRFYVTDTGNRRVLVIGLDGSAIGTWGEPGQPWRCDAGCWGVAVDRRGHVFVAEQMTGRIRKLSPEGTLLAEWRAKGELSDIAVGTDDRVYVMAADRPRLWVYDSDGVELGQVYPQRTDWQLVRPRAVAVAAPGNVVFTSDGAVIRIQLETHAVH